MAAAMASLPFTDRQTSYCFSSDEFPLIRGASGVFVVPGGTALSFSTF